MKQTGIVIFMAWLLCQLAACNTISGVGKDIKKGGESIEKAAGK